MEKAIQLSQSDIDTLAQAGVIPANTPPAILSVFAITCNQHGLSPFKKEIYLVRYGQQYNVIVGIDGMRAKASRTGLFAGRDDAKFNIQPNGEFRTAAQLKAIDQKPVTCTITIYKMVSGVRCQFTKTVLFNEYCPAGNTGKWATMPFNQIEKCAEAAALRMAFADETAGLNIEEERAAIEDATLAAIETRPEIQVNEDELKGKIDACKTIDELNRLYKSEKFYSKFAPMFTERKEQISDDLQRAGQL